MLLSGLAAWLGAFTDRDAFAMRALSIAMLVDEEGHAHGIRPEAFFCDVFESSPDSDKALLMSLIPGAFPRDPCVAAALMAVFEKYLASSPRSDSLWASSLLVELARQKDRDPRISSWARALLPRVDERHRYELESLL